MSTPPHLRLPACARAHLLQTARGPFAVHEAIPDAPSGATVLLVPGYTGSKEDFITVLAPLAGTGHRAFAIDQRGQFETPGPDDAAAYDLAELGADLLALVDAVGDGPVHVVGHSFGGLTSRAAAIASPAAFASVTLLCSGPAGIPEFEADRARILLELLPELELPEIWAFVSSMAEENGEREGVPEDVLEFMRARFTGTAKAGLAAMGAQLIESPDRTEELRSTGLATMVAYGEDDYIWPLAEQDDMARRLGARLEIIRGAAHSPAVQRPAELTALLTDFWATAP